MKTMEQTSPHINARWIDGINHMEFFLQIANDKCQNTRLPDAILFDLSHFKVNCGASLTGMFVYITTQLLE